MVLFFLISLLLISPIAQARVYSLDGNKTLVVIGQDRDTIEKYVQTTQLIPAGTMIYTSVQELKGLNLKTNYGAGFQDGKSLLNSYPNSVIQVGLYLVNAADGILERKYDQNLQRLADWINKADRPIYLRIGYEFDLPENYYEPAKYKEAYQYIVDFLRQRHLDNVNFVWHSYCNEKTSHQWMDWYPGDSYVDWFACSVFSTHQMPVVTSFLNLSKEHNKEFMIAESSPYGLYTMRAKKEWFKHIFDFIHQNRIGMFCYINSNWDHLPMFKGQNWGDARVQQNDELKSLWESQITTEQYVHASDDLFMNLGWLKESNSDV